jgi:hypothetical protein
MHKIALVLAIAAVGEALIALHLVRQLHAERENTQTLQARVTELERRPPQRTAAATFVAVPTQPTASPFTSVNQSAPAHPQPAPAAVNAQDQQQLREQVNAAMERQRNLLRDPEYREAMLTQQKMMLAQGNPDVAQELNLSADELDRLFGTLADQALRSMDTPSMWEDAPSEPAKVQELQRKMLEQHNANEAELKSVLGDAKYREWQEYQTTAPARFEAIRLRTLLANAGLPLDPGLAKPLANILKEQHKLEQERIEQYVATQGAAASANVGFIAVPDGQNLVQVMTNSVESMTKNLRRQREGLARVLTPEQLKVIEDQHTAQLQMQRVQTQLMRAQRDAGALTSEQNITPMIYRAEPGFIGGTVIMRDDVPAPSSSD